MNITTPSLRIATIALLCSSAISLAACQTTGSTAQGTSTSKQVDAVLERAADQASAQGQVRESLPIIEKLYKRNPNDVSVAVRYARALREADRLSRASIVIAPFARDERKPNAAARTEFSTVQTSLGNYAVAEEFARKAIAMDSQSADAWHVLGISLDAQGKHEEAEESFRKGLDLWQGDPAPILNNLGLNLAAQGFLDEAADTLRKAMETSPDRAEIERNLRIVSALRESGGRAPSYLQEARDKKNQKKNEEAGKQDGKKTKTSDIKPEPKPDVPKVAAVPVDEVETSKAPAPIPVPSHKPMPLAVNN